MKRLYFIVVTILLITVSVLTLTACSVNPTNSIDEVAVVTSINVKYGATTVTVEGEDALALARSLTTSITKTKKTVNFSSISYTYDYRITVTTKDAETYSFSIGRKRKETTAMLGTEYESYDKYYLRRGEYNGTVTDSARSALAALFV